MKTEVVRVLGSLVFIVLLAQIINYTVDINLKVASIHKSCDFEMSIDGEVMYNSVTSIDHVFRSIGYSLLDDNGLETGVAPDDTYTIQHDRAEIVVCNNSVTDCYSGRCSVVKLDILLLEGQKVCVCGNELFKYNTSSSKVVFGFDWGMLKCFYGDKLYRVKVNIGGNK